jgi:pyruvate/2-oxoglutarate dehydrogenase complex dihydrolipoamide dehydrogenase (E3) component
MPMTAVLRAVAIGETRGFMKMMVDAEGDCILGFTAFGAAAREMS